MSTRLLSPALCPQNRGKRLQEGAHINRSLLALGNCINALAGGARYVNFRDSKLTRLLKDALTGDCRAVMIAHVSPGARHADETRNTLAYAHRAGTITSRAGQYRDIVSDLRAEIARLRAKLAEGELANGSGTSARSDTPRYRYGPAGRPAPHPRPAGRPTSQALAHAELCLSRSLGAAPGAAAGGGAERGGGAALSRLRDELVTTFREQMRLRRALLDIDAQLLRLDSETDRQQMILSRASKLYQGGPPSTAASTAAGSLAGRRQTRAARGRTAATTTAAADDGR